MNILLILLLAIAVFLYGSELLETTRGETSLLSAEMLLHAGQASAGSGQEKTADPAAPPAAVDSPPPAEAGQDKLAKPDEAEEASSKGPGVALFEFYGEEPAWAVVNDTVMGGVSRSIVEVDTEKRRLTFSGTVSLENNGGFASTRSEWASYDLRNFDGIALRVRGDGNVYRLRIRTAEAGPNVAYTALFHTEEGQWQEVYLPFASMVPLYRGYVVGDAGPLNPASVRSFGLMVAEKQQGPFTLEVDWINAVVEKENEINLLDGTTVGQEEA
jgi:monofunctional biosynthetic peptidoglycan transglycosylase